MDCVPGIDSAFITNHMGREHGVGCLGKGQWDGESLGGVSRLVSWKSVEWEVGGTHSMGSTGVCSLTSEWPLDASMGVSSTTFAERERPWEGVFLG